MGKNALEKAVIDGCVESITDLRVQIMSVQIKQIPEDEKVRLLWELWKIVNF